MSATPQDRKRKTTKKTASRRQTGPTSATAWKASSSNAVEELEVPSGNVALVRRVGPEAFLGTGIVPDTLTPLVDEAVRDKKGLPPEKVAAMLEDDLDTLPAMIDMMNRVVAYAVVQPKVQNVPECIAEVEIKKGKSVTKGVCGASVSEMVHRKDEDNYHEFVEPERDPELLYADEVDLQDRVFIMNFAVGGTRDLARFRSEHSESMARISDEQDVAGKAK